MVSQIISSAKNATYNCLNFIEAKEFVNDDEGFSSFEYEKTWCEKAGDLLLIPVGGITDKLIRGVRRSPGVIALTVSALALVTFLFYTDETSEIMLSLVPWVTKLAPKDFRLAGYVISQATIAGLGLRTFGRYDNPELKEAWENKKIRNVHTGDTRYS